MLITNFSAIIFAKYRLDLSSQIRLLPIFIFVSWNIKIKKTRKIVLGNGNIHTNLSPQFEHTIYYTILHL